MSSSGISRGDMEVHVAAPPPRESVRARNRRRRSERRLPLTQKVRNHWDTMAAGYDPETHDPIVVVNGPPPAEPFVRPRPPKPITQVNKPVKYTNRELEEIFQPMRRNRRGHDEDVGPYYPIIGDKPGMYQSDLMFLKKFNGFIGLVVLVSINRKVAWAQPIRTKTSREVARALETCIDEIHQRFGDTVRKIETDEGTEYMADCRNMLNDRGIQITQNNPNEGAKTRTGIVERLIRTFKQMIAKHLLKYGEDHKDWVSFVPEMLHQYNYEDVQRTLGIAPADADEHTEAEQVGQQLERHQVVDEHWKEWMRDQAAHHQYVRMFVGDQENNKFAKKSMQGRWSTEKYEFPKRYGGGPSLLMTKLNKDPHEPDDYKPIVRRPMPYMLRYFGDGKDSDNKRRRK
jgi:hypothetical protein